MGTGSRDIELQHMFLRCSVREQIVQACDEPSGGPRDKPVVAAEERFGHIEKRLLNDGGLEGLTRRTPEPAQVRYCTSNRLLGFVCRGLKRHAGDGFARRKRQ